MDSLETLVERARGGDASAYEEIVRRLSRRAVATAHLIAGDYHAGEEAAQDAFVAAWRRIGTLREPAAFRAWFGRIAARAASRGRRPPVVPIPPSAEPVTEPPDEAPSLPAVARGLDLKYRQVLALRYVDGLGYREIADALGISVARVKSRLHDGRELIRGRLERRGRKNGRS